MLLASVGLGKNFSDNVAMKIGMLAMGLAGLGLLLGSQKLYGMYQDKKGPTAREEYGHEHPIVQPMLARGWEIGSLEQVEECEEEDAD